MAIKYQVRKELFDENKGRCKRCNCELYLFKNGKETHGKRKVHFHHIIHRSEGGTDIKDNLLITCWNCEVLFHNKENKQQYKARIIKKGI